MEEHHLPGAQQHFWLQDVCPVDMFRLPWQCEIDLTFNGYGKDSTHGSFKL